MKKQFALALGALSLIALTGCPDNAAECSTNTDCGTFQACIEGVCYAGTCENGGITCGDGQFCTNNQCFTCTATQGCADGQICNTAVAGGRCVGCLTDANCGAATPVCNPATSACVGCLDNGQCSVTETCTNSTCEAFDAAGASADITSVRGGTAGPIDGAIVTMIRPAGGSEPAGFFIQAEKTGPGLFVANPHPTTGTTFKVAVGDRVSLNIEGITTSTSAPTIARLAETGNSVLSSGHPVDELEQDISGSDAVALLTSLDVELVSGTGTIAAGTSTSFAATGFRAIPFNTTGYPVGTDLRLRFPDWLMDQIDLAGCTELTIDRAVMWRFNTQAQPMIFKAGDVGLTGCPGPSVLSAAATSNTAVRVTFDRHIDAASITAPATQFNISDGTNPLAVSAAAVEGRSVTLTTAAQTSGTTYTVTVASSVEDANGTGAIDPLTTTFKGITAAAEALLSEVNPNITGSDDLVELLVTKAGSTAGMTLVQDMNYNDRSVLFALPAVNVAAGDLIVLHLNAVGTDEVAAKDENGAAGTFPGAWDLYGGTQPGITFSSRVLTLRGADSAIQDALVITVDANPPATYADQLAAIQATGEWLPADCGGARCSTTTSPTSKEVAVNVQATGTAAAGNSVQRKAATAGGLVDTHLKADWTAPVANTFGAMNTAQ